MKADLHLHSVYSGVLSPKELIKECKKAGLEVVALTDHECVSGVPQALKTGEKLGIRVIPGIELQADFRGQEHHFLGYFIDYQNQELQRFLDYWERAELQRISKMIENLETMGFSVNLSKVMARRKGSVGLIHLSSATFRNPANRQILKSLDIRTVRDFFLQYIKKGGKAYSSRQMPEAEEVIKLIKRLNGIAVWAHPFLNLSDVEMILGRSAIFKGIWGMNGLEVFYPLHNSE
jgi:hypothetical protein